MGRISSEEYLRLVSEAIEPIERVISKPSGSPFYTFYFAEQWPVRLSSEKAVVYEGKGINDRDLAENSLDYVGTSFLYSPVLSKIRTCDLALKRLNIELIANENDTIKVDYLPDRLIKYKTEAHFLGVANLKYRQTTPDMTSDLKLGDGRFYGNYSLDALFEANLTFQLENDLWSGCCEEELYRAPNKKQLKN